MPRLHVGCLKSHDAVRNVTTLHVLPHNRMTGIITKRPSPAALLPYTTIFRRTMSSRSSKDKQTSQSSKGHHEDDNAPITDPSAPPTEADSIHPSELDFPPLTAPPPPVKNACNSPSQTSPPKTSPPHANPTQSPSSSPQPNPSPPPIPPRSPPTPPNAPTPPTGAPPSSRTPSPPNPTPRPSSSATPPPS